MVTELIEGSHSYAVDRLIPLVAIFHANFYVDIITLGLFVDDVLAVCKPSGTRSQALLEARHLDPSQQLFLTFSLHQ